PNFVTFCSLFSYILADNKMIRNRLFLPPIALLILAKINILLLLHRECQEIVRIQYKNLESPHGGETPFP
ncbi:hypothetical protein M569_01570, partial [Genlisea aurea]